MLPNKRKPPGGCGGFSRNVVVADGLDIFRDNLFSPKKQPDLAGLADFRFDRTVARVVLLHCPPGVPEAWAQGVTDLP